MESLLLLTQLLCLLLFHHLHLKASCYLNSSFSSKVICPYDQSHALLQFKSSFSINTSASYSVTEDYDDMYVSEYDPYPKTESWKDGTDCCMWDGVNCDLKSGNVIGLDLSSSMLYGTFHFNNSLFLLSHLQKLDLSNNHFNYSNISSHFGQLLNLTHLNLNLSHFEGQVPSEFSHLSNLVSLDLSGNYLEVDTTSLVKIFRNLTNLKELILDEVNMYIVAPSSFTNLSSSLSSLSLRTCGLHGKFLEYANFPNDLLSLDLSDNYGVKLDTTSFIKIFQNLTKLANLNLNYVNISIVAPSSFFNFSSSLSSVHLSHCGLSTKFVKYINFPSELVSLDLSDNYDVKLDTPTFSKIVQNLTKLSKLNLNDVNMSMVAPNSFFNFPSSLSSVHLRRCGLSTKFVNYINFPSELVSLDLSYNYDLSLDTTTFVKLFQNLTKLREFELSSVNLSLVSPTYLMNFSSSLIYLSLDDCRLQGKFPNNIHLSKLIYLDLSFNENLTFNTIAFNELVKNAPNLRAVLLMYVNMSLVATTSFRNLSSSVSSLYLSSCALQGDFPGYLIQRPNLRVLYLSGNDDLNGSLPPMSNWSSSLQTLDLSGTNVAIHLEPDFSSNLRSLKQLRLRSCKFIGSNLALFSNLTQLNELDLSYNNFNGEIPSSFGNLQQLFELDLSSNNFSGHIPSSFANLKQLSSLYLGNNSLSGPLPAYFSNFTQLSDLSLEKNHFIGTIPSLPISLSHLDLSDNFFNASIPSFLFSLPSIIYLSLRNNQFHGFIGQFQSNSLYYIDLSSNKLQGSIPSSIFNSVGLNVLILSSNKNLTGELSSSFCKLQSLQILDLSNNSFTGIIPRCLGNFSNTLSVLHLGANNFHGTMPAIESNNLRYLNFNGNRLQGRFPPSAANCTNLEILDLGNNQVNDTFPFFLKNLSNLQILVLHSNKLHGLLKDPTSNSSFPMLRIFDLSNNMFCGHLPIDFFNKFEAMIKVAQHMEYMESPSYSYDYSVELTFKGIEIELVKIQNLLTTIDLSGNTFTGEIPPSIGLLKSLKLLNISHNRFTGKIQPSLANLINLEALDLSYNNLNGRIPMELEDLTFLQMFRVSYNQLEGPIPPGKQFNTFDNSSYEGNSGLCGFPLDNECSNDKTQQQNPSKEGEVDSTSENGFGWQAVVIGYGCGVLFGLVIGFIVFKTRKHSWFVRMIEAEGYLWRKKFDKFKKAL